MSRIQNEDTDWVSKDVISAIKYYCFNNLTEFYRRFENLLPDMSKSNFHRIFQGEGTSREKVKSIHKIASKLEILSPSDNSNRHPKQNIVNDLLTLIDNLIENPSMENFGRIKLFLKHKRYELI